MNNFRILMRSLCRIEFKKKEFFKVVFVIILTLLSESISTLALHIIPSIAQDYSVLNIPYAERTEPIKILYNEDFAGG